jgi:Spy/CpxP family protein refolding chaperone
MVSIVLSGPDTRLRLAGERDRDMKRQFHFVRAMAWLLIVLLTAPPGVIAQQAEGGPVFKQEELEQLVAPIALHPDSLIAQILMASTYPLEVVQAERWAKQNAKLKGDPLTAALEKQDWDASVKSLVNFPQVLTMMSEKLDWTQKLGDAFLEDQKKVLDTIQSLRAKAQATGNLKSTKEQTVIVEEKIIKIEPANPQVVYVPTYNPTVVYGAWPYPAYPPYYYYPPGYAAGSAFWFAAGVGMGAAWGYAWGNANWGGGDVDIDVNRNTNINNNINRDQAKQKLQDRGQANQKGQGKWQHNPEHRKGASYRDQGTAQKFNRASTSDSIKSREQFRGRAEAGRQDLARGGQGGLGDRGGGGLGGDRGGASQLGGGGRAGSMDRGGGSGVGGGSSSRGGAFQGVDRGGSSARSASSRGSSSRASSGGGGASRGGGGGGGGGSRGGGGGGGGGRRR